MISIISTMTVNPTHLRSQGRRTAATTPRTPFPARRTATSSVTRRRRQQHWPCLQVQRQGKRQGGAFAWVQGGRFRGGHVGGFSKARLHSSLTLTLILILILILTLVCSGHICLKPKTLTHCHVPGATMHACGHVESSARYMMGIRWIFETSNPCFLFNNVP